MSKLTIGTVDLKNTKIHRQGGIDACGLDHVKLLNKFLEKQDYGYILGTQELTKKITERLYDELFISLYDIYSKYYRCGNIGNIIPLIKGYNENNAIITDKKVIYDIPKKLPFMPSNFKELMEGIKNLSIMPRIMSEIIIEDINNDCFLVKNTHLDYQLKSVQYKQLKYILESISKDNKSRFNTVLMGRFNMEKDYPLFKEFIEELDKLGMKRVCVDEKTNLAQHPQKTAVDHIFIPKEWNILDQGIINDENLSNVTENKGVYVKVNTK